MRALLLGLLVAICGGCGTTASPTYRDFRPAAESGSVLVPSLLRDAAVEAGWEVTIGTPDPQVVSTMPRLVGRGVFSSTTAALDLVPLAQGHVRVYVRAERRSVFGSRQKVYALDGSLRRTVLAPITQSLSSRGLVALDAPRDRDEDATDSS